MDLDMDLAALAEDLADRQGDAIAQLGPPKLNSCVKRIKNKMLLIRGRDQGGAIKYATLAERDVDKDKEEDKDNARDSSKEAKFNKSDRVKYVGSSPAGGFAAGVHGIAL